ncbi:GNAT family N-acetyltransferase [Geodermatophilus sp. SYSU D00758]
MTPAPTLVALSDLSAGVVRARLLAAHDRFWGVDTRARHDPLWFDQFGGFGVLARSAGGADVGYLLGVVTTDRLAVVHLLAVRDDVRRRGLGRALVGWFADLAAGTGARVVQGVARPEDTAALGLAAALGAHPHPAPDREGPGQDRVVLTRSLRA